MGIDGRGHRNANLGALKCRWARVVKIMPLLSACSDGERPGIASIAYRRVLSSVYYRYARECGLCASSSNSLARSADRSRTLLSSCYSRSIELPYRHRSERHASVCIARALVGEGPRAGTAVWVVGFSLVALSKNADWPRRSESDCSCRAHCL